MYTQLRFITATGYRLKSAKGKSTWQSPGNAGVSFRVSPPRGVTQTCLILPAAVCGSEAHLWNAAFLLGVSHRDREWTWTHHPNSPLLEQKWVFTINHIVSIKHLIQLVHVTPGLGHPETLLAGRIFQGLRAHLLEAAQRPVLRGQAFPGNGQGLSSPARPAELTLT